MDNAALILSILNIICIFAIGFLQWRSGDRRVKSGEALDWSTAMKNMHEENQALRDDLKQIRSEFQIIKDLARRLIKSPPEKGDVIVLTPIEQALLETGPKLRMAK